MVGIDDVIKVEGAAIDDCIGYILRRKNIVDAAALLAGWDLGGGAMCFYEDVLEAVFQDEFAKSFIVVGITKPRVQVSSDDDVIGRELVEEVG
jgi:hypothetical protein